MPESGKLSGTCRLCSACNRGIGMLKDDPAVLEAGVRYLRRHEGVLMTQPGESPETVAETPAADGLAVSAPMEMGDACQAAAVMAVAHGESEGRKVGM